MRKKLNSAVRVKCSTCGKVDHTLPNVELPPGYSLECDRCRQGSPGKPMKTVRHCSMCREPLVVMGVSGGVRLTCPKCAKKDPKLIEIETLVSERDKYREALNEMHADEATARMQYNELQESFDTRVAEQVHVVQEENLELKKQLEHREEASLTDRLRAKMRLKYGESDAQKFQAFAEWLIEDRGWQDTNTEIDLREVVRQYLDDTGTGE